MSRENAGEKRRQPVELHVLWGKPRAFVHHERPGNTIAAMRRNARGKRLCSQSVCFAGAFWKMAAAMTP